MPSDASSSGGKGSRGLQEDRVERDAWVGVLKALTRLKAAKDRERSLLQEQAAGPQ